MTELDDRRAAEALEVLGGWGCPNCGAEMQDQTYCDACSSLFCPYCGTPAFDECRHLLTIGDPDWELSPSPFAGLALPHLPERLDGSWPLEWLEADLDHAFADLRSVVDAYLDHNGLDAEPDE